MKRLVLALLALAMLAPLALSLSPAGEEARAQTTGAAPAFEDASITYLLDAGSDGSSTAIAIGTPAFTAGTISGGTDACSENIEVSRTTATFGVTGTTTSVFTVGSDCAITYTGAASASAISATLAGWAIRINLTDGVDASGGADTTVDDTIDVLVRLVNGDTEFADATAFRDALGGASWDNRWPAAPETEVATFNVGVAHAGVWRGFIGGGQSGSSMSPTTFTYNGTTYTVSYLAWRTVANAIQFSTSPRAAAGTFDNMRLRIGSITSNTLGTAFLDPLEPTTDRFRFGVSSGNPFPTDGATVAVTLYLPGAAYTAVPPPPSSLIATVAGTAGSSGARVGVSHPAGAGSYGSLSSGATFTFEGTTYTVRRIYWSTGFAEAGLHFGVSPQTGGANFAGVKLRFGMTLTGALSGAPTQGYGQGTANQGYKWRPSLASSPLTSGSTFSFDLVLPPQPSPWHGVTVTSGRVTALDLSDNGLAGTIPAAVGGFADLTSLDLSENPSLTGAIPPELGQLEALTSLDLGVLGVETDPGALTGTIPASLGRLTSLTTLDLSGHAGLTGSIPAALTRITGLTHLDLSRTGVCVNPATETAIVAWINAIRATGTNTGVARVAACGAPALPAFTDGAAVTRGLESGASGAGVGMAITIGTFPYTPSGHVGATASTHGCIVITAIDNPSNDPAQHLETGTARSGFTAARSGNACVVRYNGAGVTAVSGTLEAVSLVVGVGDGVDHEAGTLAPIAFPNPPVDDTIEVTVKLRGTATDGAALAALRTATGGASWTTSAGWRAYTTHDAIKTYTITAGADSQYKGWRGTVGSLASSTPAAFTRNGRTYTLTRLYSRVAANNNTVLMNFTSTATNAEAHADWSGVELVLGSASSVVRPGTYDAFRSPADGTIVVGWAGFANTDFPSSGNLTATLRMPTGAGTAATFSASSVWHGVTLTSGRVTGLALPGNNLAGDAPTVLAQLAELDRLTTLDLSGNRLTGAVPGAVLASLPNLTSLNLGDNLFTGANTLTGALPAQLDALTSLTTLDLSGNAGLTATPARLGTLAGALGSLVTLDLSGTGICVPLTDATLVGWIAAIRARNTNMGIARVAACGSPADPAFTAGEAVTYELVSGADGSTTAIAIGTPAFTQGTHVGGPTATCAISSARSHGSNDPDDFRTTGGTDVSSNFAIDPATCAITYTGTGLTSRDRTLEAVSIAVTLADGVDPDTGTLSTDADATLNVTVKLTDGQATDRDALDDFHAATGGASWTSKDYWDGYDVWRTWTITAGTSGNLRGYRDAGHGAAFGSGPRHDAVTLDGIAHNLRALFVDTNDGNKLYLYHHQAGQAETRWTNNNLRLRLSTGYTLDFAARSSYCNCGTQAEFRWDNQPSAVIPASGTQFTAQAVKPDSSNIGWLSGGTWRTSWPGLTLGTTPGRVTGIALPENNLAGTITAALEPLRELAALTTLDLSGNSLTGDIPGAALDDLTGLTSLNLGGNSLTGNIPTQLGSLTSLTSLDLGGNSLTGALPTELDSLTSLTTLDLSGNAGLTADVTRLAAMAEDLTSLTTLDLSGTGICVNPADTSTANTAVITWVNTIRATGSNTGVAKVDTCGTPAAAAFTEAPATVTRGLESGADGSTTAIEVGRVGFTQSNYLGATASTHTCAIASANDNASNDPAMWASTGTARAGFTVALSGNACVISYGGTAATGITAADGTLEAVSILLSVSDGVDHDEGTVLGPASATIFDSQIKVNVKLRGTITDGEALNALNSASGGTGWTDWSGWRSYDFLYSVGLTAGADSEYRGWRNAIGGLRAGESASITRNTRSYTLTRANQQIQNRRVSIWMNATGVSNQQLATDWNNIRLVITHGSTTNSDTVNPGQATAVGNIKILTLHDFPADAIPASGSYDITLRTDSTSAGTLTSSSTWHGVTLTSGRVTALALPNNGLTGAAATALAALPELDQLTSLDLSGNTGLTGDIPGAHLQPLTNLTSLDLSGVGWTGTIPDELDDLTALTSLDLSDNPLLTADTATLGALAAALTSLTMLDLSGTGVCLTRGEADEAAIRTWIEGIRAQNSNTGVAKVPTCGTPAGPSFTETAVTYELTSEADGSSTAIALGTPAFAVAAGTHWDSGTTECSITSARQQGFGEPEFFSTWTGYTDVSSDFAIDPSTCALTYTGSGITAVDASVEAVSVRVAVNDGPDQEAGTASGAADDTIDVTVKLVGGQPDDRNALDALYAATGGATFGWTAQTGWEGRQIHAYGATAGTAADGTKGYRNIAVSPAIGSGRTGGEYRPPSFSAGYRMRALILSPANRITFMTQQQLQGVNHWGSFTLAVTAGTASHYLKVADRSGFCNSSDASCSPSQWQVWWDNQPADSVPGSGSFSLRVLDPNGAIGTFSSSMWSTAWTGVTMDATSGRVTGLSLPDNNLVGGPLPAIMGDLAHLTALDLSGNAGITGAFPAFVTGLTSLETLNLNGIGFTGSIPTGLGALTSLTALDLGDNALTDAIPTQLGSLTALTELDLSGNSLSGAVPTQLDSLTALTSLDLSDNAGLTADAARMGTMAGALTALESLDLSGTGICADSGVAAVNEWIQDIRETNTNTGVAKVTTCGTPVAAAFTAPRITLGLEDGADGSSTAIAVGAPTFTQGTYAGATDTAACSITAARTNASNAPGDYDVTGGTDVSGDFAIDAATCAITYTGTGIASADGTLEAVSIAVSISDRLDPATGMIDATVDNTIEVTVKLRGIATDRDAIDNFHTSTGGAGWTSDLGWTERIHHTFELTGGSTNGPPARSGYFFINAQSNFGTARNSSNTFTIAGTTYTLQRLDTQANNGRVIFYVSPKTGLPANFAGFSLRNGSTTLALTDSNALTSDPNWYGWQWTSAGFTPGSGDFDVDLFNPDPSPLDSTWHGITVSGTPSRVTGLELPDNNLRGTLPSDFTELDRLTTLDLSGNPGIVGDGAAPVTAIATFQRLTTLNLSGIGYSTLGAGLGPALTALTTLDLADNRLTALPSDLGSLTTLTTLDLSGNALSGEAPDSIGDLTALTTLDLSGNRFTDVHADFNALTSLTTLDLSDNRLAAANFADIATAISAMTALTSLDLSGNADLSGSIPAALLTLTALESLDLSGTGVCVNPATEASVETWLGDIRARNSGAGVAKVTTCGTPAAPAFTAESLRGSLEAGADGSTTAIPVGTPTFTEGTYSGGATETCTIVSASENASYAPADFATTGAAVTGFTIDGTTCAIAYEGTGLSSTATRLAVSIVVGISDGVNPAEGTLSDDADDTVQVTVKLVGLATDRVALLDLYGSAGGAGWTTSTGGWTTEGATLSSAWYGATVSGTPSRLTALDLNDNALAGRLPDSFVDLSALTSLDLSGNRNLGGSIPATLGSLVALTSLDLSESGWTGPIPVELGSLTALTTLDLSDNALSGEFPSQLGNLTSLTALYLSDNAALGGDLDHLTNLTSLTTLVLTGTRLCVNPTEQPDVESWLDTLRGNGATLIVSTCGSPNAPTLADDAATYLLDVGADGSSTAVVVGAPAFTAGTYSGGTDSCVFSTVQNPSADPASFLSMGTSVTGFAVDSSNCAITWTGSSAPTRVVGTRVAVSLLLNVRDGVDGTRGVDMSPDDAMQVTVRLVDLATDKLAIEALYDDTNGASWTANDDWKTSTLTNSWHGVTLTSGRLTALALPNNGLGGRLPALMGDLSRLTSLNLSGNPGLTGGIPVEFTRLRNVTSIDLRGTRICSPNLSGAVNVWLNGIRASGGTVYLGSCPSPAPPGGSAGIVVAEEGPEAPSGLRYSLQLVCGASSFAISLGVGERYVATVPPDATCALTATDRQGATEVRGEFTGLSLAGDVVVTFVRGSREEPKTEEQIAMEAVVELERELVVGTAFARWQAPEMPVADAVEELALCVVAVFWWDAREQEWRSWFPGAEGLGVNTLRTLDDGGIYLFTTEERTADNCGLLPDDGDADDGDGEDAGDAAG